MTPYELNLHVLEYNEKTKQEDEERITIAYLTAKLMRVEKMPSLMQILEADQPKKAQTPEEMFKEIKRLHTVLGGTTH